MKDSSGVVALFCFTLKIIFWEYVGEFHPLRWIFLFFVLPMLPNTLLLKTRGKNVVTVAGMCPFFLVIVRTSTVIPSVA